MRRYLPAFFLAVALALGGCVVVPADPVYYDGPRYSYPRSGTHYYYYDYGDRHRDGRHRHRHRDRHWKYEND